MKLGVLFVALLVSISTLATAQISPSQRLTDSLSMMKKNVSRIAEPEEKARWTANVALWEAKVAGKELPSGPLAAMKANVAKIDEKGEKARWQANLSLWQMAASKNNDAKKARALLADIKAIIGKLGPGPERGRWQNNYKMWAIVIGGALDH
ncbi:MAG TPA: hypothetical protein VG820_01505 [Fimbriimonadaceae bacterium]|nr:hypothetical protein [Fimbriimonadaceae bacterium]